MPPGTTAPSGGLIGDNPEEAPGGGCRPAIVPSTPESRRQTEEKLKCLPST